MKSAAGVGSHKEARRSQGAQRKAHTSSCYQHPIPVIEAPVVKGPYPVEGNPSLAEYEIVARLSLPAPDTEVIPCVEVHETAQDGECIDVRWTTEDQRAPRGVYERSALVTIPRQFTITACAVTAETPMLEPEAGV
jgi:hypothetical protein